MIKSMITAEVSTEFWILFSIPSPFLTLLQLSYISLHPVFSYLSSNFIYSDEHLKFYLSIMFFRSPCLNTLTIFMICKHFFFTSRQLISTFQHFVTFLQFFTSSVCPKLFYVCSIFIDSGTHIFSSVVFL